jgi:carbamoyl-phosphate synthase small subunit
MPTTKPAVLALEDGSVFRGIAFGADATIAGECVFNTSMTGYQEILTDPSYFGQIVTMTAAQIGNYGVNDEDAEAAAPKASGFVVRELSPVVSNWRSRLSLGDYLRATASPGSARSTPARSRRSCRVDGAMKCCLSTLPISDEEAVARARGWKDMAGADYVKDVTCAEPYVWSDDDPANHNAAYIPSGRPSGPLRRPPGVPGRGLRLRRQAHDLPQARAPRLRGAGVPGRGHGRAGRRAQAGLRLPLQRARRPGGAALHPQDRDRPPPSTRCSGSASATR